MRIHYILLVCVFLLTSCDKTKISWDSGEKENLEECKVNLYVENSGSMEGYMHDGFEFKDAVFGYVTAINKYVDDTRFFYINSKIVPNRISLENLTGSFDAAAFKAGGGDRSSTNLAAMLKMILKEQQKNTVSVFVSDCILDLPKGAAKNYFINNQIAIEAIVSKKLKKQKDLTFVVFRLMSRFYGKYYNSTGSSTVNAMRPYYVFLIGNGSLVSQLMRKVPLADIPNAKVTCMVAYINNHVPAMTITNSTGRLFKKNKCNLLPEKGSDNYRIKILADLSSAFIQEDSLANKNLYKSSDRQFKLEYVEKIKDPESPYTHILTVSTPQSVQPTKERISIGKQETPIWIDQANDDTGVFIGCKTTGIKYVLNGIGSAYTDEDIVEMKFSIKKN